MLHLDDLRIDHDEAQLLGRKLVEHARDDRVDADALAAARGAGDEEVGHLGEVGDDRAAVDVLAEGKGDLGLAVDPFVAFEEFAEDDFDFFAVGDFDTDGVLAGNGREDVDFFGPGGAGDIFLQIGDAVDAHAARRINFEAGDGGAAGDVAGAGLEPELLQRVENAALHGEKFGRVRGLAVAHVG